LEQVLVLLALKAKSLNGWSPIKYVKTRKLQIQTKIPKKHIETGWASLHAIDENSFEQRYLKHAERSEDLHSSSPELIAEINAMYKARN